MKSRRTGRVPRLRRIIGAFALVTSCSSAGIPQSVMQKRERLADGTICADFALALARRRAGSTQLDEFRRIVASLDAKANPNLSGTFPPGTTVVHVAVHDLQSAFERNIGGDAVIRSKEDAVVQACRTEGYRVTEADAR